MKGYLTNFLSKISYKKHIVLTSFLVLTLLFILFIFNLKINNNIVNFVGKNSTILDNYILSENNFSSTDFIRVSIEPKKDLFNLNSIKVIMQLEEDLKNIDFKILEKELSKIYNDTNCNFIAQYFASIISNIEHLNEFEFKEKFKEEIFNTEKFYNFINNKNKYFTYKEAQNIISIFKKNKFKVFNLINSYAEFKDFNNTSRFKTLFSVNSAFNFIYPELELNNKDLIHKKLLFIGFSNLFITKFIKYIQITSVNSFKDIDIAFFKNIKLETSDLELLNKNIDKINLIINDILINTYSSKTTHVLNDKSNLLKEEIEWFRLKINSYDYLKNLYFSKEKDKTLINIIPIPLLTNKHLNKTYYEINTIINEYRWKHKNIIFKEFGDAYLSKQIKVAVFNNIKLIIPFFIFLILIISLITIKKINLIIFYFIASLSSLACTFGLMSLINFELNYISALIVPYALIINLLLSSSFYEIFNNNKNVFNYIKKLPLSYLLTFCLSIFISSFFTSSKIIFTLFFLLSVNTLISVLTNIVILPAYVRTTSFNYKNNYYNLVLNIKLNNKYFLSFLILIIVILLPSFKNLKFTKSTNNTFTSKHTASINYNNFNLDYYGNEILTVSIIDNKTNFLDNKTKTYINNLKQSLLKIKNVDAVFTIYDINYFQLYPKEYTSSYLNNNKFRFLLNINNTDSFNKTYKAINSLFSNSLYSDNFIISGKILLKTNILNSALISILKSSILMILILIFLLFFINSNIKNDLKIFIPPLFSIYILTGALAYLNISLDIISLISFLFILILSYIQKVSSVNNLINFLISFLFLGFLISNFNPFIKFGYLMFFGILTSNIFILIIEKKQ